MPPPPEVKRHYVAVMPQTLHAVRTVDQSVEFCGECALTEETRVRELLRGWSENSAVRGIVAIVPEPVWWHLGDFIETRTLQTDADVRRFAARLPHQLREPLEILACNAVDGKGVSPAGDERWVLGVTQADALDAASARAGKRGIVTAALGSATLDSVAAAVTAVRIEAAGVVRLLALGQKQSHVFTLSVRGIEVVEPCAVGFDTIFATIQEVFRLNTPGDAARWLFEKTPDRAAATQLAAVLAPKVQSGLKSRIGSNAAVRFACAGLTGREAWFGRAMAAAMGLPHWQPGLGAYLLQLGLQLDAEPPDTPSFGLLGTLHLAAIHPRRTGAWHPSWGLVSRTAAPRKIQRPIDVAASPVGLPMNAFGFAIEHPEVQPELPSAPPVSTLVEAPLAFPDPEPSTRVPAEEAEAKLVTPSTDETTSPAVSGRDPSPEPVGQRAPSFPDTSPEIPADALITTEGNGGNHSHSLTPESELPVPAFEPPVASRQRASAGTVAGLAVPPVSVHADAPRTTSVHADPPRTSRRSASSSGGNWVPPPPWEPEKEETSSQPTVIVLRRTGYWPWVGILFALIGAGVAGKFYFEAEEVRLAAERERRTSEQAQEMAEREIAAAVEQVRRASEQAAQAEVRARELAAGNARELERIRSNAEAARLEAIEQARREAAEQARREAEEKTVQLLARELAAARAAVSPGTLKIASMPAGAEVQVDGRPPQRAPVSIDGLPPGPHAVRLSLPGHIPQELTADIVGSKVTDLGAIKLERATGSVALSSSPAEIEFSIRAASTPPDAAPLRRGRTPARLDDLPRGEYVVRFSRAGWPDRIQRITVGGGETARVAAEFQSGTVRINSSPTGATVLQGGLLLGRTPLTLGGLPPQEVSYELIADGFEPLKLSGTVLEGKELELDGMLLDLNRVANVNEVRTPPRPNLTMPLGLGRLPRSAPAQVTVSFVVLLSGSLEEVRVLGGIDRKLAEKVVEAVSKWKFFPGVSHAGYPVKVRMTMPVRLAK